MNNMLIYVCSPYRGDVKRNKEYARHLTRVALEHGLVPVTPHLYITEVTNEDKPEEREMGLNAGNEILRICNFILVGDKYGISSGMSQEIQKAKESGIIRIEEFDGRLQTYQKA
jgi:hypothetical protein